MYQPFRGVIRGFGCATILLCAFPSFPSSSSSQAIKVPPPAAEIATVRAGRVNIAIPAPTAELKEMGPDLRVLMDVMTPPNLRLIAAFIPPDQLALLPGKLNKEMVQYALVEVPRAAEFVDVDQASYKTVVDGMSQQFSNGDLQSTIQTVLDRRLADLGVGAGKITVDKPTQLGTIFSKPDASCFVMLMPLAANGKTVTMVAGINVVRTHNRLLFAYLYTHYEDKGSIDWIAKNSESWADAILKANAQ
jgi:hypothetical protein